MKKKTKKENVEKRYNVNLYAPLIDTKGDTIKITFKREGLAGRLGFTKKRTYVFADILHDILNQMPANNILEAQVNPEQEHLRVVFEDLEMLYDTARDIVFDADIIGQRAVSEETIKYINTTVGGYVKVDLFNRLNLLRKAIKEIR